MKTILKDGTVIFTHELPDYIAQKISKHNNFYEHKLLNQLKRIDAFGNGDIIEIGANIGNHVVYYKTQLDNTQRKIFAFEPLEQNYKILEKNIAANNLSNVDVRKYGLGPKPGKTTFFVNESNFGNSSILEQKETSLKTEVEIKGVVDELDSISKSASFAKVDIEGAEKYILDDLVKIFNKENFTFLIEISHCEYNELRDFISVLEKIRNGGFKLIFVPDSNNFLWTTKLSAKDVFQHKLPLIKKRFFLDKVSEIRKRYDNEPSQEMRKKLLSEYKEICKQQSVPFFKKIFWSKMYVFFKR